MYSVCKKEPIPDFPYLNSRKRERSESCFDVYRDKKVRKLETFASKKVLSCELPSGGVELITSGKIKEIGGIFEEVFKKLDVDNLVCFSDPSSSFSVLCRVLSSKSYSYSRKTLKYFREKLLMKGDVSGEERKLIKQKAKIFGLGSINIEVIEPKTHDLLVQKKYLYLIKSGDKTAEGRANYGECKKIRPGDFIRFISTENAKDTYSCRVSRICVYQNFEKMLIHETLVRCLPQTKTIKKGLTIYRGFPNYPELEKKYGARAFTLMKV